MCTNTMDKLGKEVYSDPTLVYRYRGQVPVAPLEMVDDIITASKCGATTIALNSTVNSFVERKKLRLSETKCARIHIGKNKTQLECAPVKVHSEEMKDSKKEKYLGDFVTSEANSNDTLIARKTRAYAILAEIRALLSEIPLGSRRLEIGLALKDAWFVNGILFNSEVWSSYAGKHIDDLEIIDHMILRAIIGVQAKVPVETFYQETSTLSIRYVISSRRMIYLKTILDKNNDEVVKQVYKAMKEKPMKSDWYHLLLSEFKKINILIDENVIETTNALAYKKNIKKSVWNAFSKVLQETSRESRKAALRISHLLLSCQVVFTRICHYYYCPYCYCCYCHYY